MNFSTSRIYDATAPPVKILDIEFPKKDCSSRRKIVNINNSLLPFTRENFKFIRILTG